MEGKTDVVAQNFKVWILHQMEKIASRSGKKIVDAEDFMPLRQKALG